MLTAQFIFTAAAKENKLYAIRDNGNNASVKWVFETDEPIYTSPVINSNGIIYVGTAPYENKLYAIRDDGDHATVKWTFQSSEYIIRTPAISNDGMIYVPSGENLYALHDNGDNVIVKWIFSGDSTITTPPLVGADTTIYFGTFNGTLYCLNDDGTVRWSIILNGGVETSLALTADGVVYVGTWDNDLNTWLHAVDPNGALKWSFQAKFASISSPITDAAGTVYFSSGDTLYALSSDGARMWSYSTAGSDFSFSFNSSASIGIDGTLYVAWETPDGGYALYAFGPISREPDITLLLVAGGGTAAALLVSFFYFWRRRRR